MYRRTIILAAANLMLACQIAAAATLYVSTTGDDANPGTEKKPFATLERARDEIRLLKASRPLPAGGFTVEVRGGIYKLSRPFELTAKDSGTENAPVVYRARKGEIVRLVGGRVVTGWKQVTDPVVLAQLDESARGKVWQAELRALGITDFGEVAASGKRLEFFFLDKPMTVARWPNEGFIKITEVLGATPKDVRGTKGCKEGKFVYDGDRPKRWVGEKDIWVHGYWFWDWAEQRQPVESIDIEKHVITVKPPYHGYGYRKGQWFYAFNLLSELDRAGEWYLDRSSGVLYFWPPAPLEQGSAIVSVVPMLVTMKDASYVIFQGMILEACRGTAIQISGSVHNLIAGCTIRNTGQNAISISGTKSGVVGCDIYETGDGGISLNGGDRKSLIPGMLYAENNHIHHFSRWDRMCQPGIRLGGVGNRACHNMIDNAPHMAIQFSGNDHLIEFNEIYSVCYESNDAGAMYAGQDWTMRGTMIRYNYLHNISGYQGRGCVGLYNDDQYCGTTMYGNLFYDVTMAAFVGGGRDCVIENNIFVDCRPAVHVDDRGLGWAHHEGDEWIKEAHEKGTISGILYNKPPYSERYPKLVTILDENPNAPLGNLVARNICVGGKWDDLSPKLRAMVTFKDNLIDEDPHFVDREHLNFQLKDDSPAYKLGFKQIPIEKIGLYQDELRVSWPVKQIGN